MGNEMEGFDVRDANLQTGLSVEVLSYTQSSSQTSHLPWTTTKDAELLDLSPEAEKDDMHLATGSFLLLVAMHLVKQVASCY